MERWWRLWRQPETAKRCDCDGVRPRLIAQAKRGTPILCSALLCSALLCSGQEEEGRVHGVSERRRRRWTWVGGWWSIPCTSTPRKRSPKVVGYLPARPAKTLPWWRSATAANTWSSPVPLRCVCISLCLFVSLSLLSRACFKSLLRILPHATRVCISCYSIQSLLWILPHATRVCISCYCIQSLLWILPHVTTRVCISWCCFI